MKVYGKDEINNKLQELKGWQYTDNKIQKNYTLKDFAGVISVVNKVADEAEKMNHHPDILIHSWNKVKFSLYSHSEDGITQNDFDLAGKIEEITPGD